MSAFPGIFILLAILLTGSPAAAIGESPPIAAFRGVAAETLEQEIERTAPAPFLLAYEDQVRLHTALRPETPFRVVGPVFTEYLHILVRNPVQVHRPEDFARLRVWIGDQASKRLAELYFDYLGLPLRPARPVPLRERVDNAALQELATLFRERQSDIALIAADPRHNPLCGAIQQGMYTFIPLDYETRRFFVEQSQGTGMNRRLRVGKIPPDTYPGQAEAVPTVARSLLLLVRQGEESGLAREKLAALRESWKNLHGPNGICLQDSQLAEDSLLGAGLPWLEGFQPDNSPGLRAIPAAAIWGMVLVAVLGLSVLTWRRGLLAELRHFWAQDKLPFAILLALGLSILAITIATHFFEKDVNEKFSSIPESFWSITVYLFSGLEDRTPYTRAGRFVATLGLLLGPAFFAVMSGWLARFFIRREKRMPQNLRNHYLLLNWNERAINVVREIHHPILIANGGPSVVVLLTDREDLKVRQLKEAGSGQDEAFEDFYLSIGDPTSERGLLNANAQDARTIVIFADEAEGDERTFRSIFALRRIARERGLTTLHVVAELVDPANACILNEMARDFPGLLESVSNNEIRTLLVSQAAMNPGAVGFYTDLLRTTGDTNELYTVPIPDGAAGVCFCDYAAFVLQAGLPEPLVPVGIQRIVDGRARMLTNPRPQDPASLLCPGDRLLVFAYTPPAQDILPVPAAAVARAISA